MKKKRKIEKKQKHCEKGGKIKKWKKNREKEII